MANELSLAQKREMSAKNMNGGCCPKKKSINLFPYPQLALKKHRPHIAWVQDRQTFLSLKAYVCIRFINVTKVFVFFFSPCLRLSPNVAPPWDSLCFLSGPTAVLLNAQQQLDNNKGVTVLLLFLSHSRTSFVQITLAKHTMLLTFLSLLAI